jgi:hypothetical protein
LPYKKSLYERSSRDGIGIQDGGKDSYYTVQLKNDKKEGYGKVVKI